MHISRRTALIGITAAVPLVTTALAAPADAATPSGAADSTGSTGSSGTSDSGVLAVQRWLNTTFGHLHGWVHVDEDGLTGSGTVLGIVQATQSLLGISPSSRRSGRRPVGSSSSTATSGPRRVPTPRPGAGSSRPDSSARVLRP